MGILSIFRKPKAHFSRDLAMVLGIVLVWRGIWYMLDALDKWLFGESHFWTAVIGAALGLLIIYWQDKNLSAIGRT